MENNWVRVYTTQDAVTAEIIKQGLMENDIAAVVMNKKDSSYQTFGTVDIMVSAADLEAADAYIKSIESE
ncbi:putative signal transducing protein [Pedobacter hartonius]|uniref:Putative signal transducing protein n=1 Tax=Pedobacter hartonius TaxID=425514 RepID=A0A1H4FAM1_9SPHI|nr:DUF2007 domain-containing protein [Pedobacter hartonius]SEA93997.1 Putative signal transducing protein [Pedobacter hartonius]